MNLTVPRFTTLCRRTRQINDRLGRSHNKRRVVVRIMLPAERIVTDLRKFIECCQAQFLGIGKALMAEGPDHALVLSGRFSS